MVWFLLYFLVHRDDYHYTLLCLKSQFLAILLSPGKATLSVTILIRDFSVKDIIPILFPKDSLVMRVITQSWDRNEINTLQINHLINASDL